MKKKQPITEKYTLSCELRTVFGKKIKKLRKEGKIPANVFGQNFKSTAIAVNEKEFFKIYRKVKETGIIYLQVNKEEIPVLINHIQYHPVSSKPLHIDFRKVDLSKKIETMVPVKLIGESEAVNQKQGVLLTHINELKIEAKPGDIPPAIEIDISCLKNINQEIKVEHLPKATNYIILEPPEKVIISVVAHKEESVTPETKVTEPEVIMEKEKEEEIKPQETEKEINNKNQS